MSSNIITLPRFCASLQRRYVTRTADMMQPLDVALAMALVLRNHGTVNAVRAAAHRMATRVCMEQQPKLKAIARRPTNLEARRRDPGVRLNGVPDDEVLNVARNIVDRVTNALGIAPGVPFELFPLQEPPRCHWKPMRLAGEPGARHWKCQHCSHTKPVEVAV